MCIRDRSQSIHRQVEGLYYDSLLLDYYRPFWNMGIPVDFVTAEEELDLSLIHISANWWY